MKPDADQEHRGEDSHGDEGTKKGVLVVHDRIDAKELDGVNEAKRKEQENKMDSPNFDAAVARMHRRDERGEMFDR